MCDLLSILAAATFSVLTSETLDIFGSWRKLSALDKILLPSCQKWKSLLCADMCFFKGLTVCL